MEPYLIQAAVDIAILAALYSAWIVARAIYRGVRSFGCRLSRDYQEARAAAWIAARAARRDIYRASFEQD